MYRNAQVFNWDTVLVDELFMNWYCEEIMA